MKRQKDNNKIDGTGQLTCEKLRIIGLSSTEISVYSNLFQARAMSRSRISQLLVISRSSTHRSITKLEKYGFIERHKFSVGPDLFRAIELEQALSNLALFYYKELLAIILIQREHTARRNQLSSKGRGRVGGSS